MSILKYLLCIAAGALFVLLLPSGGSENIRLAMRTRIVAPCNGNDIFIYEITKERNHYYVAVGCNGGLIELK